MIQDARFVNYWHFGGRENKLASQPSEDVKSKVLDAIKEAKTDK